MYDYTDYEATQHEPNKIVSQSTLVHDLDHIGRLTKETINGVPWFTVDVDLHRSLDLDEVKQVRDSLTALIGDQTSGYDRRIWEEDTSCNHHVPCAGPCGTGGLRRKR